MPHTPNETLPRQFRLKAESLADLDLIAAHLTAASGIEHTRSDAVRWAARREAEKIRKKSSKKT